MVTKTILYLQSLVRELTKLPSETEWVEFKCNYQDPQMIGEYISALSNSATLVGKPKGYLIWGINNETHNIVGTGFNYRKAKKGNENLENWLAHMLNPRVECNFYEVPMSDDETVIILEVACAQLRPVSFSGVEFIRVGASKKKLNDYPDKERELWKAFDSTPYELRLAACNLSEDEVFMLLDYPKYYGKLGLPIPKNRDQVLVDFQNEKFLSTNDAGKWDITNMGAILLAKEIKKFEGLLKKTIRVIWYKDKGRADVIREKEFNNGYISSHEEVVQYIMTIIPQEEVIVGANRTTIVAYPEIAIRELLANSMIHQAIEQKGTNIMVELFSNRIEFSNAGCPLVEIDRIIDTVPVSRNENIAGFMRKCNICEERGSGYEKIITATSKNNMPAPIIRNQSNQFTKVIMLAQVPFEMLPKEDKIRTCYMQACLAYMEHSAISNADLRILFEISDAEIMKITRLIKDTIVAGLIKPVDINTAQRYMKYIPFWA
ncbi:MAG: putative DNA binding domain-containing protein [Oscillospiraceae bacterium]|jgi:predicted HTH transcriptional regulator|nr:putative DNA binding domain-containing protein [Oscillospiraceae bacterium]